MSLLATLKTVRKRNLLVPEVLQTSMMDCGPATLKSVFDGFRRPINLERLRERCQTDVDGTSIAAMQETADRLGLEVSQVMVPKDSLLLPEATCLPAIIFLINPDGLLHFVTIWNQIGSRVQVMDPARGRVWIGEKQLLASVATPTLMLPKTRWRAWAGGPDFAGPLLAKMRLAGLGEAEAQHLLESAKSDTTVRSLAALDAATRMVRSLIGAGALARGAAGRQLLRSAFETDRVADKPSIPRPYWICLPGISPNHVAATGAVLLCIEGVKDDAAVFDNESAPPAGAPDDAPPGAPVIVQAAPGIRGTMPLPGAPASPSRLPPTMHVPPVPMLGPRGTTVDAVLGRASGYQAPAIRTTRLSVSDDKPDARRSLAARASMVGGENTARMSIWSGAVVPKEVLQELRAESVRPHQIFARMMWEDSRLAVTLVGGLLVLGMGTSVLDALVMRGVSELVGRMNLVAHRLVAIAAVVLFLILALLFEFAQAHLVQRLARGLEARLRVAFLEKLPRLEDRYFRSRPISDMASRAHLLQTLRGVPRFAVDLIAGVLRLITTAGVLVWLEPRLWKLSAFLLFICLCVPFVSYRLLDEAMARMRILGATLYRFYLDALLGVVPIRVHGAERAVRREHEGILTEWVRSSLAVETRTLSIRAVERLMGTFVAVAIVVLFVRTGGDLRALLLVALFAQRLPGEAEALVGVVRRYPLLKHDALRLFEPLAASETEPINLPKRRSRERSGVTLNFIGVTAVAGGRPIVSDVNLIIARGQHVAIVGPSGAGKSSLVSILLGWLFITEGRVLVDGRPLDAQRLAQLREETAWVDPAVQLWNTSLLENLLYGHGDDALAHLEDGLTGADLLDVIERLPDGLQSKLGEGGARVSGGQGQRVRFGRGLLKRDARLVILDEPFRGLERDKRRKLLRRARQLWSKATILFVSHDVGDTTDMDRVLVVKDGGVIEDGAPADLLRGETEYRDLVEGDQRALAEVWGKPEWKRLRITDGRLETSDSRAKGST
jgi:ATP-binding cassette subfamily B protein